MESTEHTKATVERFFEAMNSRQLETLDELIAHDVARHCQATPGLDVRSLDQLKDFLRQDAATFPDNVQTLAHVVAEDDHVAVWATYTGTQRGPMGPFAPSGRKATFDFAAIFRLRRKDRRVVDHLGQHDDPRAAGPPPCPPKT